MPLDHIYVYILLLLLFSNTRLSDSFLLISLTIIIIFLFTEIPVIPDLDDVKEEELSADIAKAPRYLFACYKFVYVSYLHLLLCILF